MPIRRWLDSGISGFASSRVHEPCSRRRGVVFTPRRKDQRNYLLSQNTSIARPRVFPSKTIGHHEISAAS